MLSCTKSLGVSSPLVGWVAQIREKEGRYKICFHVKGSNSKLRPRDELRCKDWKFIDRQNPKKLAYLDKWITDYGFKGQLNSQQITALQDEIKQQTKNNPKKMKKCGYEETEFWLQTAVRREEGQSRSKMVAKEEKR